MNDDNDLQEIEQKAYRDTMRDGFTELFAGVFFVLAAAMIYKSIFVPIFVALYIIILPQALPRIRQKYTYPRIGYVKPRVEDLELNLKALLLFLLGVVVIGGIATALMTGDILDIYNWITMIPFIFGMIMLGPSAYLVEKTGLKRFWIFGASTSISGLLVSYLTIIFPPLNPYDGILAFCFILGAGMLLLGLITFTRFIRNNPIIEPQED
ncbi:MAG: hypothetical protein ACW97A_00965 [Candidatus Thorarchaeota archaeon]|jgi:hypothetical protein